MAKIRPVAAAIIACTGIVALAWGLWMPAKAMLAEGLISRAWQQTLAHGTPHKPWSWADTWPVAELHFPAYAVQQVILDNTSGQSMAFAPGYQNLTGMHDALAKNLGAEGVSLFAAHRDTHFRFLEKVKPGDRFTVNTITGTQHYQVTGTEIVDSRKAALSAESGIAHLILLTCYPFDSLAFNGPLRYAVFAERVG